MSTTRTVTVYNVKGGEPKKIETSAEKWGELREEIRNNGYNVDSLLATESATRRDLNNTEAVLPEGEFIVFLRPKKTKSGIDSAGMSYKDCKKTIKELIEQDGEHAKEHFLESYGKNYTHMSTAELRQALTEYVPPVVEESNEMEEEESDRNVADVVQDVADSKTEETEEIQEEETIEEPSPSQKAERAIELLEEICEDTDDEDLCERVNDIIPAINALKADIVDWEDPEAAEAREREAEEERKRREERERLDNEAQGLLDGFND